MAIALGVYSHVIPGMDEQATSTVASLILGDDATNAQTAEGLRQPRKDATAILLCGT